ncbi:hypothetical protein H2198_002926 [Neophaeococcomyces mojaviensis]|uniref:Uncharacterized protein n=1 Tax=Neophaeococcomyces mojaviensis TaxID=3383035 RepID=A0ACC3ACW5_9EURO|nr:hypothetical protein H2198_002926 [Knufia sp. JES_112]
MGNSSVGYIVLNAIRALNIVSLLACTLAAGSLMVKTSDLHTSLFNLFDAAEKVLIILICLFLLLAETPRLLRSYFARNWPLFSHSSGFFTFSLALLFIGVDVLSWLTKEKTDEKHLGGDFYRMVLAAGIMTILMSAINIIASIFCRDRKKGLTARQVRGFKNEFIDVV